jgi:mannose-6-phosphate isomerase-like protein (cupin superfamily)
MTQVSVVAPDGGEAIQLGPIQMRILEDGQTTGHRLGVGEITIPPGTQGPPQHRHAEHDEGFYVVSGTARFTVADTTYDAPPGTMVMVPPGAPHTFANPGSEPVVLLNTFTPDLYLRYFRDLRQMIANGQLLTTQSTEQAMSRYATVTAADYASAGHD